MTYYYADNYTEEDGSCAPGQVVDGQLMSGIAVIPRGCTALHFDRDRDPKRFVLSLHPQSPAPLPGWVQKTAEEIEADYPGILGGA